MVATRVGRCGLVNDYRRVVLLGARDDDAAAGGVYVFLREAYGRSIGFLYG